MRRRSQRLTPTPTASSATASAGSDQPRSGCRPRCRRGSDPRRRSRASHWNRLRADRCRHAPRRAGRRRPRRCERRAAPDQSRQDWDELEKILTGYELCWLGQQAVASTAVAGVSEIELFTNAQAAAQIASGGPIEFVCDLLSGRNTAKVCCRSTWPARARSRRETR